jgi:putative FmdB family regulatory protein
MPIRDFTCLPCSHRFESLVRNESDMKEVACPKCGNRTLQLHLSYAHYGSIKNNGASARPNMVKRARSSK